MQTVREFIAERIIHELKCARVCDVGPKRSDSYQPQHTRGINLLASKPVNKL